jgi:hypothetical protein
VKRSPLTRNTPLAQGDGLKRRTPLRSVTPAKARSGFTPASPAQRAKVKGRACIVCSDWPCHPAHVIDRSIGGTDDPRDVVPLCPQCHRSYDDGELSILEFLEPHWRDELARAVELVGLLRALQRCTGERYVPERRAA